AEEELLKEGEKRLAVGGQEFRSALPNDVWVLSDGCENAELIHNLLSRSQERLALEACAKDHAVGTSASGPIEATWPLLVSRQPAALDERVGCDGRPAARVHGVLRPVSGFWVDQVVRKVREEGSLETKTLLDGHPATAPLLGLMLQELRAVAFVEVDLVVPATGSLDCGPGGNSRVVRSRRLVRSRKEGTEEDILAGVSKAKTWASQARTGGRRCRRFWPCLEGCPPCYVVRTSGSDVAATLEALGDSSERLVLQPGVSSLCWVHTFDDSVVALDPAATSPLRGLADVFFSMRPLFDSWERAKVGLPRPRTPATTKTTDRLTIACLLSLDPTLTQEEVMGRLLNRSEASAWGEGAAVDLEEVVRDTMLAADQDQVLRQLATKRASQEKKAEKESQRQGRHRQTLRRRGNVDLVVRACQSFAVRVYKNDKNGRWKLTYSCF
ncbi:unnamed protein product, partial [Symbiodinium microadriaticum]